MKKDERDRNLVGKQHDSNPDPITGEPGAHPIGVGGGSASGAAAGAAVGAAVGGPIGAAVGGVVGAVAGGYAGKGVAEMVNPTEEDTYWRTEYARRPYYKTGETYDTYAPAYRYGWESAAKPEYNGRSFEEVEPHLERNWATYQGAASRPWRDVRDASRDSYMRVHSRTSPTVTHASETTRAAGRDIENKGGAFWDEVKGNWHQMKGTVKEKWNDLTDDEIDQMDGHRERIIGKIQERYGRERWNEDSIERELRNRNR